MEGEQLRVLHPLDANSTFVTGVPVASTQQVFGLSGKYEDSYRNCKY